MANFEKDFSFWTCPFSKIEWKILKKIFRPFLGLRLVRNIFIFFWNFSVSKAFLDKNNGDKKYQKYRGFFGQGGNKLKMVSQLSKIILDKDHGDKWWHESIESIKCSGDFCKKMDKLQPLPTRRYYLKCFWWISQSLSKIILGCFPNCNGNCPKIFWLIIFYS